MRVAEAMTILLRQKVSKRKMAWRSYVCLRHPCGGYWGISTAQVVSRQIRGELAAARQGVLASHSLSLLHYKVFKQRALRHPAYHPG